MIYFNKYGTAHRCLVFLHGLCENNEIWNNMVSEFSKHYTVLCFDLPGFGKSPIKKAVSIEEMAKGIQQELQELKISNPIIIGHSMGGYVALAYADLFPKDISGLVLFHSTSLADDDDKKMKRKKQIASIVKYGKEPFLKELYLGLFSDEFNNETARQKIWNLLNHAKEEGIINALEAMMKRKDTSEVISNATFPVLLLAGENDKIIPLASQENLEKLSPNCRLKILRKSGHMGMVEEAPKSQEILWDFFKEINA